VEITRPILIPLTIQDFSSDRRHELVDFALFQRVIIYLRFALFYDSCNVNLSFKLSSKILPEPG
jgi:hypothetical protein